MDQKPSRYNKETLRKAPKNFKNEEKQRPERGMGHKMATLSCSGQPLAAQCMQWVARQLAAHHGERRRPPSSLRSPIFDVLPFLDSQMPFKSDETRINA